MSKRGAAGPVLPRSIYYNWTLERHNPRSRDNYISHFEPAYPASLASLQKQYVVVPWSLSEKFDIYRVLELSYVNLFGKFNSLTFILISFVQRWLRDTKSEPAMRLNIWLW